MTRRILRWAATPLIALASALALMLSMIGVATAAPPPAATGDRSADNLGWNFQVAAVNGVEGAPNVLEPGDQVTYQANIWENSRAGGFLNLGRYITAARITAPAGFTLVDTHASMQWQDIDEGDDGVKFECQGDGCSSVPVIGGGGFHIKGSTVLRMSATFTVPDDYQPGDHMSSFHFDVYSFSSGQGGSDLIGVEVQDNRLDTALALDLPATAGRGAAVPLTATVSPADATGDVQFLVDGVPVGDPVAVSGGSATLNHTFAEMGAYDVSAEFTASAGFRDAVAGPVQIEVGDVETAVTVTVPGSAQAGDTVELAAVVTPAEATGDVQFAIDGAPVGAPVQVTGGTAVLNHAFGDPGEFAVTAAFTGGFGYGDAVAEARTIAVDYGAWQTTTVVVEPVEAEAGSPANLMATVRPIPTGGTVTFTVDGAELGTVDVGTADGVAVLEHTFAESGTHQVTAAYSGTDGFDASTSDAFTATVVPTAPVLTAVDAGLTVQGLSVVGQSVTLTATVDPADAVGEVQFYRGAEKIGAPVPVIDGKAQITTELVFEGTQVLSAKFLGGEGFRDTVTNPVVLNVSSAPEIPDAGAGSLGSLLESPLAELFAGSLGG